MALSGEDAGGDAQLKTVCWLSLGPLLRRLAAPVGPPWLGLACDPGESQHETTTHSRTATAKTPARSRCAAALLALLRLLLQHPFYAGQVGCLGGIPAGGLGQGPTDTENGALSDNSHTGRSPTVFRNSAYAYDYRAAAQQCLSLRHKVDTASTGLKKSPFDWAAPPREYRAAHSSYPLGPTRVGRAPPIAVAPLLPLLTANPSTRNGNLLCPPRFNWPDDSIKDFTAKPIHQADSNSKLESGCSHKATRVVHAWVSNYYAGLPPPSLPNAALARLLMQALILTLL